MGQTKKECLPTEEKSKLTVKFFQRKMGEYDNLKKELRDLEAEIKKNKEDEDFS